VADHRVAVVGAAGFGGAVAASIVDRHPLLELTALTARSDAGKRLRDVYPRHRVDLTMDEFDADRIAAAADAAIVGYPHRAAAPVVVALRERGLKVVDLSADFRLSQELYEREYQPHEASQLLGEAVYGLPELGHRAAIAGADLVGAPGCYPTASLLGLWPLREIAADAIVDAKSGVSGAGRDPSATTHFVAADENVTPYKVEGHRHRAELDQELPGLSVTFTPHLLPIDQGLLASCYVTPKAPLSGDDVRALLHAAYDDEPFVEIAEAPPGVRDVRETNLCRVYATVEPATGRVLAFAAIDNLWKGAAGQAVQCLNLMLGLPETAGLEP
jgi:N-acetyl-gamma-glutamyl-phosphate reductase